MSNEEQVRRLTRYMANFVSHIAKKLPDDVIAKLDDLRKKEDSPLAKVIYETMARNQKLAAELDRPSCQDTGVLQFWVKCGTRFPLIDDLEALLKEAVIIATEEAPLRHNSVETFDEYNTGKNVGKRLAIVLDGKVYSAPRINERIGGGSGQISGGFSVEEAHDVAIALRSGALLAPVKVSETRSIGPSLGQDSIDKSMAALSLAAVAILIFMILYYGVAGLFADIALVVNILFLIACMALFGATLTLPGMAGIVLTIGMAVDANVIINERVREVLRTGVSIRQSINKGYENAMSAIVDSNITTLITSAALYAYGTGPVKGFAVTMSIGIVASMITAILGTHGMFELVMDKMEKSKNTALWLGYKLRGGANASVR